eukprot:1980686-Ditylum_brightwellii.AAC.1
MHGPVGKLTVRFGDGLMDMQQANTFSTYRGVQSGNNKVRRHRKASFLSKSLEQGLNWALSLSKHNSSKAFEDI